MVLYSNLVTDVFWTEEWTMGECLWLQDQTFGLPTETMSVRHQHSKFWQTVIIRHIYILTASNSMSATFSSSFFGLAKLRRHASGVSFRSATMSAITTSSRRFVRSQRRWQNGMTYAPTNRLTGVGARDTCVSKNVIQYADLWPPHSRSSKAVKDRVGRIALQSAIITNIIHHHPAVTRITVETTSGLVMYQLWRMTLQPPVVIFWKKRWRCRIGRSGDSGIRWDLELI